MLDQIVVVALVVVTFTFLTRKHPRPDSQLITEDRVEVKDTSEVTSEKLVWVNPWEEEPADEAIKEEEVENMSVPTDYSLYTVRQLRQAVKQTGAKIPHNATKANLIKVLQSM